MKIGGWLNTLSEQPDWFWVSAAKRTVQTAQLLSQNPNAKLIIEQALYLATAEELLGILRTTPEEQYNIAIVAHNPGISDLVDSLCNIDKYHVLAPSDIAYFQLACEWSEVKPNKQYSVSLIVPDMFQ